jgi:ribosomal protein L7/L12
MSAKLVQILGILKAMTVAELREFVSYFKITLFANEFLKLVEDAPRPAFSQPEYSVPMARVVVYNIYGKKIQLIKLLRTFQNLGLKDAKDLVDAWSASNTLAGIVITLPMQRSQAEYVAAGIVSKEGFNAGVVEV